ncbi:hypothetical protein Tco_1018480 [Tanacetum coccineum]|uniref:Uncharacterized protein n=1 Tax=Tanacetum coccineum TaxID=301880 RepID=A0ABQ5FUL7_9ASTR
MGSPKNTHLGTPPHPPTPPTTTLWFPLEPSGASARLLGHLNYNLSSPTSNNQGGQYTSTCPKLSQSTSASAEATTWTMTTPDLSVWTHLFCKNFFMDDVRPADDTAYHSSGDRRYVDLRSMQVDVALVCYRLYLTGGFQCHGFTLIDHTSELYPSDFEDLYLLNLQGHLNHLSPEDKKILTTVVNLWTRNLVIRKCVEDFQLGIESYQMQLNLTKPRWDAKGFEYKHDFTVIDSPRAITFRDKYGVQMIMRFNEIHKFSDGTLHQIDEALDYKVKEFNVNRRNPGLDTRFWTKKDIDRSKEFMFAIQKPLKTIRLHKDGDADASFHFRNSDKYYHDPEECELRFALAFWLLKTAFWLLRFASRFGCVLPQDHCVLPQDHHCVLLQHLVAFCFKTIIAFW